MCSNTHLKTLLQAAIVALGYEEAEADQVFEKADRDKEGSISYEEFVRLLTFGIDKSEDGFTFVQVSRTKCSSWVS